MGFSKELKERVNALVKSPNDNPPIIVNGKVDGYYNDLTKEGKEMYDDGMRFNLSKK